MKRIILATSMFALALGASQPPYNAKGWVLYDKHDTQGKWHLGAQDKRKHFIAGMMAGSWATMYWEKQGWKNPKLAGFVAALIVGYGKEVYDIKRGSGTGEYADALWTAAGGAAGATIVSWRW